MKVVISFYIEEELIKILEKTAKREDVSASHIVNKLLKEKLINREDK